MDQCQKRFKEKSIPRSFSVSSSLVGVLCLSLMGLGCGNARDSKSPDRVMPTKSDVKMTQFASEEVYAYPGDLPSTPNIQYAKGFSEAQVDLNANDLKFLKSVWLDPKVSAPLVQMLKTQDSSPFEMVQWVQDRIRYIVPVNFVLSQKTTYAASELITPFAPFGDTEVSDSADPTGNQPVVVMSNVGAYLYALAKSRGKAAEVDIEGVGLIHVYSPRVGLIQEGEGHFMDRAQSGNLKDLINTLTRTKTLLHEARHGDGNSRTGSDGKSGASLGFFHVKCPAGHPYQGQDACDANTNGPYSVAAAYEKAFLDTCKTCSPSTQSMIRALYLDSASRVIPGSGQWDDSPENAK